jgi:hypothetical protein
MKPTDRAHENARLTFEAACAALARQADAERSRSMATSTPSKSSQRPSQAQPTPKPQPPATETRVLPDGTIERYAHGRLVSTTPPPKAKPPKQPAAAPQAPPPPASPQAAVLATGQPTQYLARLGTTDIWAFEVKQPQDPDSPIIVRRFIGYDQQGADKRYAATQAGKLWREMLTARGYAWIDGQVHKLVDEDE